jgi:GntR family transcriptional regulator
MSVHKLEITAQPREPDMPETLGFRPLYRQVKAIFVRRLMDGVWAPGAILPSEGQLAAEIGVSQGTVRKALDELAAENLVVRRQGRGTFVAEHDERRILFQFFKLAPDQGAPRFPDSVVLSVTTGPADDAERTALDLQEAAPIIRIRRQRSFDGAPLIVETVSLPQALFPGLESGPIPNNLYSLYAGSLRHHHRQCARTAESGGALGEGRRSAGSCGWRTGPADRPYRPVARWHACRAQAQPVSDPGGSLPFGPALNRPCPISCEHRSSVSAQDQFVALDL